VVSENGSSFSFEESEEISMFLSVYFGDFVEVLDDVLHERLGSKLSALFIFGDDGSDFLTSSFGS